MKEFLENAKKYFRKKNLKQKYGWDNDSVTIYDGKINKGDKVPFQVKAICAFVVSCEMSEDSTNATTKIKFDYIPTTYFIKKDELERFEQEYVLYDKENNIFIKKEVIFVVSDYIQKFNRKLEES